MFRPSWNYKLKTYQEIQITTYYRHYIFVSVKYQHFLPSLFSNNFFFLQNTFCFTVHCPLSTCHYLLLRLHRSGNNSISFILHQWKNLFTLHLPLFLSGKQKRIPLNTHLNTMLHNNLCCITFTHCLSHSDNINPVSKKETTSYYLFYNMHKKKAMIRTEPKSLLITIHNWLHQRPCWHDFTKCTSNST